MNDEDIEELIRLAKEAVKNRPAAKEKAVTLKEIRKQKKKGKTKVKTKQHGKEKQEFYEKENLEERDEENRFFESEEEAQETGFGQEE